MDEQDRNIEEQGRKVDCVQRDVGAQTLVLQRVEKTMADMSKDLAAIAALVGTEQEDGNGGHVGTGIMGRLRRVEKGQETLYSKYKTWLAWGGGFASSATVFMVALWWLISDKLEIALKGAGQ